MPKIVKDEDIFQAVIQVISEFGFAGATTKQMAEAAHVSEVTLFRKYDSKLELIERAVNALIARSDFDSVVQYTGDLNADLLRVVRTYQESAVQYGPFIFRLLAEIPRDPELTKLFDIPAGIFGKIGGLLEQYQTAGKVKPEPPMHAMAALLGPLVYVSMVRKAMPDGAVPPLDFEQHVTHFLQGRLV